MMLENMKNASITCTVVSSQYVRKKNQQAKSPPKICDV